MSNTTNPISAHQFALALESLPAENLYAKALEIRNSIAHLQRSNVQLQQYSDAIASDRSIDEGVRTDVGDKECLDAIRENDVVIGRQRERVELLKSEVERRGGRWHEMDPGDSDQMMENGDADGDGQGSAAADGGDGGGGRNVGRIPPPGGRLTDEDLRRQLTERLEDEQEDGMHL